MSHRLDPGLHPGLHGQFGLVTGMGAPTTVLAGVMTPTIPLFDSVWFQVLVVFVAINTLLYAGLAVAKLVPRRRLERARGPYVASGSNGVAAGAGDVRNNDKAQPALCVRAPDTAAEPISAVAAPSSSRRSPN